MPFNTKSISASLAGVIAHVAKCKRRGDWAMINFTRGLKNNEPAAFDLLGWLQSDGCFALTYWALCFAPKDMQYYDYLKEIGIKYMGWPPCETTKVSKTCTIEVLQWGSKYLWPLGRILRRPELFSLLWQANDECKIKFLRMYDAGDGQRKKKDYHAHYLFTSEPQRAIDLSNLALSAGLESKYSIKDAVTPAGNPTKYCWARIYFKVPIGAVR